jgi:hypothetical protein
MSLTAQSAHPDAGPAKEARRRRLFIGILHVCPATTSVILKALCTARKFSE